jgi:hypothetical protein
VAQRVSWRDSPLGAATPMSSAAVFRGQYRLLLRLARAAGPGPVAKKVAANWRLVSRSDLEALGVDRAATAAAAERLLTWLASHRADPVLHKHFDPKGAPAPNHRAAAPSAPLRALTRRRPPPIAGGKE